MTRRLKLCMFTYLGYRYRVFFKVECRSGKAKSHRVNDLFFPEVEAGTRRYHHHKYKTLNIMAHIWLCQELMFDFLCIDVS